MSLYVFYHPDDPADTFPLTYMTPTRMVGQVPCPYQCATSPSEYLEFAIKDAAEGTERGHVNSFTNVKRAFHLATDILLHQYGLFKFLKKENFPGKLRVLEEVGLIPTTIIGNLNLERNEVEHEYAIPSKRRVAEAIDVGKLVLMAVAKYLEMTPQEVVVGWRNPARHLVMQLEPEAGELRFYAMRAKNKYRRERGVTYFVGRLRDFSTGEISPGVSLARHPWKTIKLNKASMGEWSPIIKEMIAFQRKELIRGSLKPNEAIWNLGVAVPMVVPEGISFSEILTEGFKKRANKFGPANEDSSDEDEKDAADKTTTADSEYNV
jgi:hypothetical protein